MNPFLIISVIVIYFLVLMVISYFTGKGADNQTFFIGGHKSPWYLVAFGMIGTSLSGVTFISVPGWVGDSQFSYMQVVLGYLIGYIVIGTVLMPLYYRLNLTSIYTYLERRFGVWAYKTGAFCFLVSRVIGAAFRLFLVANVLQITVFDSWGVPFYATVILTIILIWLYTSKGGIKTIVWTDSLQTLFMLLAVGVAIYLIGDKMEWGAAEMLANIRESNLSKVFFWENWNGDQHFIKQFLSGAFIAIVMTGLDQDMMQKNLSCKNIGDAQKNMFWFSIVLVIVNLFFLALGALLYIFANKEGIAIPERTDDLFPLIATGDFLHPAVGVFFIMGLVAAAYSSADSALTALTTSVCIDFLRVDKKSEKESISIRKRVHIIVSFVLFLVIVAFEMINDESVIKSLFVAAGYTYGPLLGMFAFGLLTKFSIKDKFMPYIAFTSPLICLALDFNSKELFNGYEFGFELLILNGLLTFTGMLLLIRRGQKIEFS